LDLRSFSWNLGRPLLLAAGGVDLFEEGKEALSGFTCSDGHQTSMADLWAFDLADGAADPAVAVTKSTAGSR